MLYETLNHPSLFLIFMLVGLCGGLIFDLGNFIKFLFYNKKIPCIILDVLQTSLALALLFLTNLHTNYGQIRLFPAIIFLLAFSLERQTLGKLIAKLYNSCYNLLKQLNKRIWRKKNDKTNKAN